MTHAVLVGHLASCIMLQTISAGDFQVVCQRNASRKSDEPIVLLRLIRELLDKRSYARSAMRRKNIGNALADGDLDTASTLCNALLAEQPDDVDSLRLAGIIAYRQGNRTRASLSPTLCTSKESLRAPRFTCATRLRSGLTQSRRSNCLPWCCITRHDIMRLRRLCDTSRDSALPTEDVSSLRFSYLRFTSHASISNAPARS